jgi:hypothetical protein
LINAFQSGSWERVGLDRIPVLYISNYLLFKFNDYFWSNSGLGFRPRPRDENVESTLIWFKQGQNEQNWKHWTENLVKFLERKLPFHVRN